MKDLIRRFYHLQSERVETYQLFEEYVRYHNGLSHCQLLHEIVHTLEVRNLHNVKDIKIHFKSDFSKVHDRFVRTSYVN